MHAVVSAVLLVYMKLILAEEHTYPSNKLSFACYTELRDFSAYTSDNNCGAAAT